MPSIPEKRMFGRGFSKGCFLFERRKGIGGGRENKNVQLSHS
jgi:hypothetical protein